MAEMPPFSPFSEEIALPGGELRGGCKGELCIHMIRQRLHNNLKPRIFLPDHQKSHADLQELFGSTSPCSLCSCSTPSQRAPRPVVIAMETTQRGNLSRAWRWGLKTSSKAPIPLLAALSISEYKIASAC